MNLLFHEHQIQAAVRDVARDLNQGFVFKRPDVIVCTLSGGVPFFSDLIKLLEFDFEIDFIRASSYKNNEQRECTINGLFGIELGGKNILVIEDMVDTGKTLQALDIYFKQCACESVTFLSLLKRKEVQVADEIILHYCLEVGVEDWLVGYGLDDNGLKRNLTSIYKL